MLGVLPATLRADQPSGNTNSSDNTPWNRRLDDARVDEIKLKTDRYDTVTEVVVITPDCAFRSDTRNINRRNVNRIGFTQDIPLIGGLFENTPRAGRLDGSNQIGLAYPRRQCPLYRHALGQRKRQSRRHLRPGLADRLGEGPGRHLERQFRRRRRRARRRMSASSIATSNI